MLTCHDRATAIERPIRNESRYRVRRRARPMRRMQGNAPDLGPPDHVLVSGQRRPLVAKERFSRFMSCWHMGAHSAARCPLKQAAWSRPSIGAEAEPIRHLHSFTKAARIPGASIYLLDNAGIHNVRYEDTQHYAVTKAFLQDPAGMLRRLFKDVEHEMKR
jgi:hypothetical protein